MCLFSNFDVSFNLCLSLGVSRKHFGALALKSNGFLNGLNQEMCVMQAFVLNNF